MSDNRPLRRDCKCICHGPNGKPRARHLVPCCIPDDSVQPSFCQCGRLKNDAQVYSLGCPECVEDLKAIERENVIGMPSAEDLDRYAEEEQIKMRTRKVSNEV